MALFQKAVNAHMDGARYPQFTRQYFTNTDGFEAPKQDCFVRWSVTQVVFPNVI